MQRDESSTSWCTGLRQELSEYPVEELPARTVLFVLTAAGIKSLFYFEGAKGPIMSGAIFLTARIFESYALPYENMVQGAEQEPDENEYLVINVHDDSEGDYGSLTGDNNDHEG